MSGNIGALQVEQQAEALEQALKDGESWERLAPLVDALRQDLDPLVQALAAKLPQATAPAPTHRVAVDEAELERVTRRLGELLRDMDSEAGDWLGQHQALLASAYPAHLPGLQAAVEAFDFDAAIEQLDAGMAARAAA